ncbi:PorP/SprF family type IX secretion system membrane protein [Ekhidna sp.]
MRYYLSIILSVFSLLAIGQEGQFSQYYASGQLFNPAYIGTNPNFSLNSNYKRTGTKGSENFLELMQASVSYPLKRRTSKEYQTGAVGAAFWRESRGFQGLYTAQKILLTGAYTVRLTRISNQNIIFGLQGGIVQSQISDSNFEWGSQFSRYIGFDNALVGESISTEAVFFPTFNFGVVYTTFDNGNYYIRDRSLLLGLSVDYLNEPEIRSNELGLATRNRIFKAFAYSSFKISPRWSLSPTGYALYSDGATQLNAGMYFSTFVSASRAFNAVFLQAGAWYRYNDSVILLAGFKLNEISIGASIDLNTTSFDINEALGNNLPSYEISLTYNLDLSRTPGNVSSPIF